MKKILNTTTALRSYLPALLLLLTQATTVVAQYDRAWTFGNAGGLNFSGGAVPQQFTTSAQMRGNSASICDRNGNLLFYTDGNYVWNKQHNLMAGGVNLTVGPGQPVKLPDPGNGWMSDATAIAMKPGDPGKYYIFSERREPIDPTSMSSPTYPADLYYSIVDISLNNGLGEVIEKGTYVDSNVQKLTCVAGNDCNLWLVTHQGEGNAYKAYNITEAGVNATPVISVTGSTLTNSGNPEIAGTLTCSPDRSKLVLTNMLGVSAELSAFDPATGVVSAATPIPGFAPLGAPPSYPFGGVDFWQGAAFSPDNTKLYLTDFVGFLVQFDLTVTPFNKVLLGQLYTGTAVTGLVRSSFTMQSNLKTGPDGKIYFHYEKTLENGTIYPTVITNDNGIGIIQQPNITGAGCNVSLTPALNMVQPPFGASLTYFPNENGILLIADTAGEKKQVCFNDSARLVAADTNGYAYLWNTGGDSAKLTAYHTGLFTVSYFTYSPCVYHVDSFEVQRAGFEFTLGPDTTLCYSPPYTIGTMVPGGTYRWQNGSTTNNLRVNASGTYTVAVTKNGCTLTDSIALTFIDLKQDLGDDILFCEGEAINVRLKAKAVGNAAILWNTGNTQPDIAVRDTGTYWVQLQESICTASDTMTISYDPLCYCHFSMPNAFSPNADGLNDVFLPAISAKCPVTGFSLSIFNRWGQRVFSSAKAEQGWDGNFNGSPVDAGTYMYQIRFLGGTKKNAYYQKGDIVLIR